MTQKEKKMELEKELKVVKQDRMSLDTSCSQLQQDKNPELPNYQE